MNALTQYPALTYAIALLLFIFFSFVCGVIASEPAMFTKRYARRHRICGGILFVWLIIGFIHTMWGTSDMYVYVMYDVALSVLGISTAVSAAYDFRKAHNHIKNRASGTLDEDATVTFNEMIEHSFYQGLNLAQIVAIHAISLLDRSTLSIRVVIVMLATSPWLLRSKFPVHSFSDNYNKGQSPSALISILYRAKKYQYVFYKHFLLHGLSFSVAISGVKIAGSPHFRLYWLCLNTSYVLEFFLQTLVKKKYMSQFYMLLLQHLLMAVSTIAAIQVLPHVYLTLAMLSLLLNFTNRKRELVNATIVVITGIVLRNYHKLI